MKFWEKFKVQLPYFKRRFCVHACLIRYSQLIFHKFLLPKIDLKSISFCGHQDGISFQNLLSRVDFPTLQSTVMNCLFGFAQFSELYETTQPFKIDIQRTNVASLSMTVHRLQVLFFKDDEIEKNEILSTCSTDKNYQLAVKPVFFYLVSGSNPFCV